MIPLLPTNLKGPFAVATQGLTKHFGEDTALQDVDLQVPEGAVYVLVGPNGAGKTTLLELLLNLVQADGGTAKVFGLDCRTQGPAARAQIGYVSARQNWEYGWMPVGRLLKHHSVFYPTWDNEYAARLADVFALRLDKKFGKLSKGHARRVQLVLALAHRPPLLLMDEPTDGLDRIVRDELLGVLAEHIAETPTTMLISTHLVYEIDPLADHLGVLREGRLAAQLPRERLHRMLHRYRAEVPEEWTAPQRLNGAVVRRSGSGREINWIVWGKETEVARHLTQAGAIVREASPLTLDDAVLALLRSSQP